MGREKSSVLYVRCTPEVKDRITRAAAASGKPVSDYLCDLVSDSGGQSTPSAPLIPPDFWAIPEQMQEVSEEIDMLMWNIGRFRKVDRHMRKRILDEADGWEELRREILRKYVGGSPTGADHGKRNK